MIKVDQLQKSYDGIAYALKGVSFEVAKGEVIGFLGPNGAGKSTTMKILTGFLLPTAGRAEIAGFDVQEQSLEVRRRIGYLPELNPLYMEMRVDDYLRFAGQIRGVAASGLKASVDRVVELCKLEKVTGKNILELSKGYKQRVGLAQAMVHRPDLLILDEPTSGLDPNQVVEVRELIKDLGREHTVMLSTHILQEVEASCSRIMIINLGELVADGTVAELVGELPAGDIRARIQGPEAGVIAQVRELVGENCVVEVVEREGDYLGYRVVPDSVADGLEEGLAQLVVKNGWGLNAIWRERRSLEDFFRHRTYKAQQEAGHA
ncbi:MAG: ATP-binding cassette domain-containing protein [Planctomycetota bacterium]|nr:ATP-binding cassette domain-containing protein [Planctomycetota bacterium]